QIERAIAWNHLLSWDLVPLLSGRNARRTRGIDSQAESRAPRDGVFHKFHGGAVPGEEEGAGALQTRLSHKLLIRFQCKLGARRAVRPKNPRDIDAGLITETKVEQW